MLKQLLRAGIDAHERRRERYRPSGFRFALSDRIDLLSSSSWDSLTSGGSFFLDRAYLRAVEREGPVNLSPRYALVFDGDRPLAAVSAQMADVSADLYVKTAPRKPGPPPESKREKLRQALSPLTDRARSAALVNTRARMLVCGNLLSWGFHGVAFAPDAEPRAAWAGVAEALYRIRRAERIAGQTSIIMVKDVTPAEADGAGALRTYSYKALETEPDMVLDIPAEWTTFDDYLAGLTGSYRKAAKKIIGEIDAAGATLERLDAAGIAAHADRLHELYLGVQAGAACRPVTFGPGFLPALAEAAGDRFRCTAIRAEGRIVGFVTSLADGPVSMGYYIGFDREANSRLPIYFRLLQTTVADAIETGCSTLSLGRTALEPKARLGASPRPMSVWLRARQPVVNAAVHQLLRCVAHDEAPVRNPFK